MSEMVVPGKPPAPVPSHLAGTAAVTVGRRILWRAISSAFYVFLIVAADLAAAGAAFGALTLDTAQTVFIAANLVCCVWFLVSTTALVRTGADPIMRLTGVRWVRFDTGAPASWAGVGKLALQAGIGVATLGLGAVIICFTSMDGTNRTWFDRQLGIIPLDIRKGRDPYTTPAPTPAAAPEPSVRPWNATASAAASLPPVPTAHDPDPAPGPWEQAVPVPSPATPPSAPNASVRPNDYIVSTPWSGPGEEDGGPAPAVPAQPLSFTPPSSSEPVPSPVCPQDEEDDRTQLGVRYDTARIVFDTGAAYPFGGTIVLGRNPVPPPTHPSASPVPIDDPDRTVSKTHIALTATREGVLVDDLHSTGGTVVRRADGQEAPVLPGSPVLAAPGDSIRYGLRSVVVDG